MNAELDDLLAEWAAVQQLTPSQVAEIRANVLVTSGRDRGFDTDWLWSLTNKALRRWPFVMDDNRPLMPYLQLA